MWCRIKNFTDYKRSQKSLPNLSQMNWTLSMHTLRTPWLTTPTPWQGQQDNDFSSSAGWGGSTWAQDTATSTGAPERVSWLATATSADLNSKAYLPQYSFFLFSILFYLIYYILFPFFNFGNILCLTFSFFYFCVIFFLRALLEGELRISLPMTASL